MSNQEAKIVLEHFKSNTKKNNSIRVSVIEPHIFLKITKEKQHFWSPHLHLEVLEEEGTSSTIKGLFGPNPVVWTMFMFLHFIVAGVFIGCGVWAYVNHSLNESILLPILLMIAMVIIWILFYFGGQVGKERGKEQMNILYQFMQEVISESSKK
jgi:hypothetical protein